MKTQQDYHHHKRYYFPHHFILYPVAGALVGICLYLASKHPAQWLPWTLLGISFAFTTLLSYMMRQHYALMLQNRVVRLEMRLRYYILSQKRFEELEKKLSFKQIAALRFASDAEFIPLIERTLSENLSPDDIKRSIQEWQADKMRV